MLRNWVCGVAALALVGCGSTGFSNPDTPDPLELEILSVEEMQPVGLPVTLQLRNVTPDAVCLVVKQASFQGDSGVWVVGDLSALVFTSVLYADGSRVVNPLDRTIDPMWAMAVDPMTVTQRMRIEAGEISTFGTFVGSDYLPEGADLSLRVTLGDETGISGLRLELSDCLLSTRAAEGGYRVVSPLFELP